MWKSVGLPFSLLRCAGYCQSTAKRQALPFPQAQFINGNKIKVNPILLLKPMWDIVHELISVLSCHVVYVILMQAPSWLLMPNITRALNDYFGLIVHSKPAIQRSTWIQTRHGQSIFASIQQPTLLASGYYNSWPLLFMIPRRQEVSKQAWSLHLVQCLYFKLGKYQNSVSYTVMGLKMA